jgi:hypothetical protein
MQSIKGTNELEKYIWHELYLSYFSWIISSKTQYVVFFNIKLPKRVKTRILDQNFVIRPSCTLNTYWNGYHEQGWV